MLNFCAKVRLSAPVIFGWARFLQAGSLLKNVYKKSKGCKN